MNERILKLAKQAGVSAQSETTLHPNQVKFAELIVKECLEQIDKMRDGLEADNEDQHALGADWAGLAVARHFGVE